MRIPTLPLARLCALRVSRSQLARHYSSPSNSSAEKAAKEEVPFSESPAYFGRDRKILDEPIYIPGNFHFRLFRSSRANALRRTSDYYDSNRYRMKKFMSAVLSTMAVVIYVAYFRWAKSHISLPNPSQLTLSAFIQGAERLR